jgi:O-antigen/teichoic acid export membrane protein
MTIQLQYQMEDVRRKKEEAIKSKGSGTIILVIGIIMLIIAILDLAFTAYMIYQQTYHGHNDAAAIAICGAIVVILGLAGLIMGVMGLMRRSSANREYQAADSEGREIMMRLGAVEGANQR